MSTPIKRKLAAILSADVAGYSRLMGDDEEGTLRLLAAHRAVVDSIIGFHDGRVVNTAGDSVLAEFTSPVESVRAATEIQEALKTRNESLPAGGRMLFRIGVNLGDVMIQGDDLLGDGVNVAARLQALAEPGGICISGSIFDQIEGKLSLHFQDIGEQTLKNIPRPVRALQLRGPASKASAPSSPAHPRTRHGAMAALVGAGLIALAGGAYLGGFTPQIGPRAGRQEAAAWQAVQSSSDIAALESYLAEYPAGPRAGEARARIAGLLAGARQAAEAERGASERARAEAELARLKAQAEAARLKAEVEAVKERPAATRAPGASESRFDGVWVGELSCPGLRGGPGLQRAQRAVVRNGQMTLEMALLGRPRPNWSAGQVRDDDSIELRGPAILPGGRTFDHVVKGRFSGTSFTAQAEPPARPCSLQLSREPAPARPGG